MAVKGMDEIEGSKGGRLKPLDTGTIFVLNTIHQGMFKTFQEELASLRLRMSQAKIPFDDEMFLALGPFDNVLKIEVDDYCVVNDISNLPGIGSQQIQCAYTIWQSDVPTDHAKRFQPFCLITQLKIQNYLTLGSGPEIEDAVAELLIRTMEKNVSEDTHVELMGSLGWDEFFIFQRNRQGFSSLFAPVWQEIRGLTLTHLKPLLTARGWEITTEDNKEYKFDKKHLFLSSYSTPAYSMDLSDNLVRFIEDEYKKLPASRSRQVSFSDLTTAEDRLCQQVPFPSDVGSDSIVVSTKLAIKPGHVGHVRDLIREVLAEEYPAGERDTSGRLTENLFSMGRFDVYSWLGRKMTCREFILRFELLRYALSGNLHRLADYEEFLQRTQYYNSFTIISDESDLPKKAKKDEEKGVGAEGEFVKQLKKLTLSGLIDSSAAAASLPTIREQMQTRELLCKHVPYSIVIGLTRIFALYDACIIDRFTCDTFLDMLPFMTRVRNILDTVRPQQESPHVLEFRDENSPQDDPNYLTVVESKGPTTSHPLVVLFHSAINRFYKGFCHRYLTSYPMMDKNETGVDFCGRMHRALSAITGMQNLLMEDLGCNLKKGFNVISTYPNIRIYRDSFDISEANVLHLLQIETFCILYHEMIHSYYYSPDFKPVRNIFFQLIALIPDKVTLPSLDRMELLFQEITGDLFFLRMACLGDLNRFTFFYWLQVIQAKKPVDMHMLLRFIIVTELKQKEDGENGLKISNDELVSFQRKAKDPLGLITDRIVGFKLPEEMRNIIEDKCGEFIKICNNDPDDKMKQVLINNRFSLAAGVMYSVAWSCCATIEKHLPHYEQWNETMSNTDRDNYQPVGYPPRFAQNDRMKLRPSIIQFQKILKFLYDERESLRFSEEGIVNFRPQEKKKRAVLFARRIALLNALYWESSRWKARLLTNLKVTFPIKITQGKTT